MNEDAEALKDTKNLNTEKARKIGDVSMRAREHMRKDSNKYFAEKFR